MANNNQKKNEKFESRNYKSLLVIGVKHGGDRDYVERYMSGASKEIILGIASIMTEIPAFAAMVEEAVILVKSAKMNSENGNVN